MSLPARPSAGSDADGGAGKKTLSKLARSSCSRAGAQSSLTCAAAPPQEKLALMYAAPKAKSPTKPRARAPAAAAAASGERSPPPRRTSPSPASQPRSRSPVRPRVGVIPRLHDAFRDGGDPEGGPARAAAFVALVDATPRDRVTLAELDAATAACAALQDGAERAALAAEAASRGFLFTALRCVIDAPALLRGALAAVRGALAEAREGSAWAWPCADRDALCAHFAAQPAVADYAAVAPALRGLGPQGATALAQLEEDLICRICSDFEAQLGGPGDVPSAAPGPPPDARALLASATAAHAAAAEERRAAAAAAKAAEAEAAAAARRAKAAAAHASAPAAASPSPGGARVAEARRAAQLEAENKRKEEALLALERQKSALAAKLAAERARADAALAALAAVAPPAGAPPAQRPRRNSAVRGTPAPPDETAPDLHADADAAPAPEAASPFVAQHNAVVSTAPTAEEIAEYAVFLGMHPEDDKDLHYIAEWALTAPLPAGWSEHADAAGNEYYFNARTGVSTFSHPLDDLYRNYWRSMRAGQVAVPAAETPAAAGDGAAAEPAAEAAADAVAA